MIAHDSRNIPTGNHDKPPRAEGHLRGREDSLAPFSDESRHHRCGSRGKTNFNNNMLQKELREELLAPFFEQKNYGDLRYFTNLPLNAMQELSLLSRIYGLIPVLEAGPTCDRERFPWLRTCGNRRNV